MKWAIEEPLMREMSEVEVLELKRQAERDAWDQKHPRCGTCGQFLKKNPHFRGDETPWEPPMISHWYRSSYEYNEWDHI